MSDGGAGDVFSIDGNLTQTSSGKFAVDVDMGGADADLLDVGGTAILAGKVKPTISENPITGSQEVTILTAEGGVTSDGIGVKDTALVDYSLLFPDNAVVLRMDVDFDPSGLAKEQSGVGQHLNDIFKGGGPDQLEPLALALLQLPSVDAVSNAYLQLSGENYRALPISTLYASEQFSTDMMSCAARDGTVYAFIDEN
jgi:uncharacterized protein with beta-barrel porin domain